MTKYMIVNDLHIADKSPALCTDSYTDDLFDLLEQTVAVEEEEGCLGTIWAGDVFHIKAPNRNSHALVQRTQEIVKKYRNLWIVPGNHDYSAGERFESVMTTQPLGVLFRSGAKLLKGWEDSSEHPLYGVPWLQRFTAETVKEAFTDWNRVKDWNPVNSLVVTHAPLYPPGQELEWENYPTRGETGWSAAMGGHGYVAYGHVHDTHGIYIVDGVTYANPGALSRGSLTESTIKRKISTTIWDSTSGFTFHELNYRPAEEVFRMADKKESVAKQLELDDFLASIGQAHIEISSTDSVMQHVRSLGLGAPLVKLIQDLLEGAE